MAYVAVALTVFLSFRRRPLYCVWPVLALLLVPVFGTLLAVCAAAAFGRRRAPLIAAWTAIVTYLVVALAAPLRSAFAGYQAPGLLAGRLTAAGDPLTLLIAAGRAVVSRPCLFQAALWAGLALAMAVALRLPRLELRLWVWSLAFSAFYLLGRLVPVSVWRLPAGSRELLAQRARGGRRQRPGAGAGLAGGEPRRGARRRPDLGPGLSSLPGRDLSPGAGTGRSPGLSPGAGTGRSPDAGTDLW